MTDYLLLVLMRSSVILGVALLLIQIGRKSPVFRVAVGRIALFAVFVSALMGRWSLPNREPIVPVAWPEVASRMVVASSSPKAKIVKGVATVTPSTSETAQDIPVETPPIEIDWLSIIAWAWIAGSIALGANLLIALAILRSVRKSAQPAAISGISVQMDQIARELECRTPRVYESDRVSSPFVAGLIKPAVYLPTAWSEQVDEETRSAVLRHEAAHIANGDLRWIMLHRLLLVLMWPNLLLWLIRRPMAAASEALCDRQVLLGGVPNKSYARALLDLKSRTSLNACPALGIGVVSVKSSIRKRIEAILDNNGSLAVKLTRKAAWATRIGVLAVAAGAITVFALPLANQVGDQSLPKYMKAYSAEIPLVNSKNESVPIESAWLVFPSTTRPDFESLQLPIKDGKAVIDAGKFQEATMGTLAMVTKTGRLAFVQLWPSEEKVSQLRLVDSQTVSGTIILPDKKPAEGVRIVSVVLVGRQMGNKVLEFLPMPEPLRSQFSAVCDREGKFRIDGLPKMMNVRIDVADTRFAHIGMIQQPSLYDIGKNKPYSIQLATGSSLSGRVTRNGKPVSGIYVSAQATDYQGNDLVDAGGNLVTDSNGVYILNQLLPAEYNVSVTLMGGLEKEVTARAYEKLTVEPNEHQKDLDFDLIPGSIIEGSVKDESGRLLPNVCVSVYGPAHPDSSPQVQTAITDKDGNYLLRVPAGKQRLYISDGRYEQKSQTLMTEDGETSRVNLIVTPSKPGAFFGGPDEADEDPALTTVEKPEATKPIPSNLSFGPSKPFYGPVKLPNGAVVRLAYVQCDDDAAHTIWRPNGAKASQADKSASLNMSGFPKKMPGRRHMYMKVDVSGEPNGDCTGLVITPNSAIWAIWQSYGDSANKTGTLVAFNAPDNLKTMDIKFGLAAGPYKTVQTARIAQGILNASIKDISKLPQKLEGRKEGLKVTISFPAQYEGLDATLDVWTKDGKKLELSSFSNETTVRESGKRTRTYSYTGRFRSDVAKVALKVRPYYWTTFRGIHLYPNK